MPSVPMRAVTRGPGHHWFGYYDKLQFDPTSRFVLGMRVDFEHRSPTAADTIRLGVIDLADGDRWTEIGVTRAWCWQQGCMLQWLPGSDRLVIYNDREADRFVARIHDLVSGETRTVDHPVYALSPDGRHAVTPDFRRINYMRPGYGYTGLDDPHRDDLAPAAAGIHRVDLTTGAAELIVSVAQMNAIPNERFSVAGATQYFNHLLYSPTGERFIFLHRWRDLQGSRSFDTRMLTAAPDGQDLHVVDDYNGMSHFIWRDAEHILAWARRPDHGDAFYLFRDRADQVEPVGLGVMTHNGHCTYLPGNEWILNDIYPNRDRQQELYLYRVADGQKVSLGFFASPREYAGEWRCDLHPRSSPDGRLVTIDSPHGGDGRQIYLLDISAIVG